MNSVGRADGDEDPLAQLKAEGLVTYKTNRGAFVTALSPTEAKEIYLMRIALETMALKFRHDDKLALMSFTLMLEVYREVMDYWRRFLLFHLSDSPWNQGAW